ncbi:MAG: alpha/beta hydrolase, partial [Peptococcaceae bacterium]|nr:alpha/beta hydrolase [Peptococcaceae bacterium]
MPNYSVIDLPPIIGILFYPRRDFSPCPENAFDLDVPVEENIRVTARFYSKGLEFPTLLYFHGNGEVVFDYDYVAPIYNDIDLNLVVADYRGYGASTGSPSFGALYPDARLILQAVL